MSAKKTEEKKFFKEQIINSEKFGKYKDLLSAVLDDKTAYTEKVPPPRAIYSTLLFMYSAILLLIHEKESGVNGSWRRNFYKPE